MIETEQLKTNQSTSPNPGNNSTLTESTNSHLKPSETNSIEVKDIYKQQLVLCATCGSLISYKSSLGHISQEIGEFSNLYLNILNKDLIMI